MAGMIVALLLASPASQFVKANGVTLQYVDCYGAETLVEDIRAFLDDMRIDRVGHSIAGVERTRFAVKYPARVPHLVYLDAAYDMGAARDAAFFVVNKPEAVGKWYGPFELGYKGQQIAIFKRDMKRGRVVEFRDTDHVFFNDPKKVDGVVGAMRAFLARP